MYCLQVYPQQRYVQQTTATNKNMFNYWYITPLSYTLLVQHALCITFLLQKTNVESLECILSHSAELLPGKNTWHKSSHSLLPHPSWPTWFIMSHPRWADEYSWCAILRPASWLRGKDCYIVLGGVHTCVCCYWNLIKQIMQTCYIFYAVQDKL